MIRDLREISLLLVLSLGLGSFAQGCNRNQEDGAESSESTEESAEETPPETGAQIAAPADVAAAPANAERSESGLAWRVLEPGATEGEGAGQHPDAWDEVTVHYTGWTTDGEMFDSSVQRGQPARFRLDGVIAGWTEGVQLMTPGEKRRFWIPAELAYGNSGRPGTPQGTLVFDIELVSIRDRPAPPAPIPAPEDVAAIPDDAERSESGLAWKVLTPPTGDDQPNAWDSVVVNYTGWTTDGQMFDSSVQRGVPATLPLNRIIPGWREALQLMKAGEKRRLWIPQELAYNGAPGAPAGMLVFEVELLSVERNPEPPPAPSDVAAVPANAERSESGLAWRVLEAGDGDEHPTEESIVEFDMSMWVASSGELFDSTVVNGRPILAPLNRLNIPGWREGLPLMVVGEQRRFWIPQELAFNGAPQMPEGMVVCDITLRRVGALGGPPAMGAGMTPAGTMEPGGMEPGGMEPGGMEPGGMEPGGMEPETAMLNWGSMATPMAAPAAEPGMTE